MNKSSAIANVLFGLAPLLLASPVVAFSLAENVHPGLGVALAVFTMLAGLLAFALAKFTRFRSGRWFSFGYRGMPVWTRRSYVAGYAAMAFGVVGSFFLTLLR